MEKPSLVFKITGKGISPESVDAKELMDVLSAFQTLIIEKAKQDNPEFDLEKNYLSLIDISKGSAVYSFASTAPTITFDSYVSIQTAINKNEIKALPFKSIESLRKIHSYAKKNKCKIDLIAQDNETVTHAIITSNSSFSLEKGIKGETFLYGTIIRVGGKNPTVTILCSDESHLTCDVSIKIAKELAKRLYEYVGLRGVAKWIGRDLGIDTFRVVEVLPFEEKSLTSSFQELKKLLGKYYDDIENPSIFIKNLRDKDGDLQ